MRSLATAGDGPRYGPRSKVADGKAVSRTDAITADTTEFIGEVWERSSVHAQLLDTSSAAQYLDVTRLTGETADPREWLSRPAPIATQEPDGTLVQLSSPTLGISLVLLTVTLGIEGFIGFDHISLFDHRDFKIVVLNDLK
jgi:hypothetical protein